MGAKTNLRFGVWRNGGIMTKLLRLNEVRVLLALNKDCTRSYTIEEIAEATAEGTPSNKGISTQLVRRALNGDPPESENSKSHEVSGYPGLIRRGFVTSVGKGFQISLPDIHKAGSEGDMAELTPPMTPETVAISPELRAALTEQAARTGRPAQELFDAAAKFYALLPPDAPPGSIPGVDPTDILEAMADADAERLTPHAEVFARRRARK
jgi:hypothetical protein